MSTNYYWTEPACAGPCAHCTGPVKLHIGQLVGGPSWSFQGYFPEQNNPLGLRLTSWAEWCHFLNSEQGLAGRITSEYGTYYSPAALSDMINGIEPINRRRQYDWIKARSHEDWAIHSVDVVEPLGNWLDADGFSFYGGSFS